MIKRKYKLLAIGDGRYEILSEGFSFLAFFLQVFWAIANGTFLKYFILFIPVPILGFVAEHAPKAGEYLLPLYIVGAFYVYYPLVASNWRERILLSKGYTLKSQLIASSAKNALKQYSLKNDT